MQLRGTYSKSCLRFPPVALLRHRGRFAQGRQSWSASGLPLPPHLTLADRVPSLPVPPRDGQLDRRRVRPRLNHANRHVVPPRRQIAREVEHGGDGLRPRHPAFDRGVGGNHPHPARAGETEGQQVVAIGWRDARVLPPHGDPEGGAGSAGSGMLQAPQHEPVTQLAQEAIDLRAPLGLDAGRLVVQVAGVELEAVVEDVANVPPLLHPLPHGPQLSQATGACLQASPASLPAICCR